MLTDTASDECRVFAVFLRVEGRAGEVSVRPRAVALQRGSRAAIGALRHASGAVYVHCTRRRAGAPAAAAAGGSRPGAGGSRSRAGARPATFEPSSSANVGEEALQALARRDFQPLRVVLQLKIIRKYMIKSLTRGSVVDNKLPSRVTQSHRMYQCQRLRCRETTCQP